MVSSDEMIAIVYNDEMYNAGEERERLAARGYVFSSTSDTEVILTLFRDLGPKCLPRIRGIFALAIVDYRSDRDAPTIYLARDALGVKPLLYFRDRSGTLIFGSELKALLASGLVPRTVEPRALRSVLSRGSVTQPDTLVRGVTMVAPAHFLVVRRGEIRSERYWQLGVDRRRELRSADYRSQVAALTEVLGETVRAQLAADVPVGSLLSGGVDSATLTALMAAQSGHAVRTFSIGFDGESRSVDETEAAARIAAHLGTEHTRFEVDHETLRSHLDRIVDAIDQPSIDGLNSYFVSLAMTVQLWAERMRVEPGI